MTAAETAEAIVRAHGSFDCMGIPVPCHGTTIRRRDLCERCQEAAEAITAALDAAHAATSSEHLSAHAMRAIDGWKASFDRAESRAEIAEARVRELEAALDAERAAGAAELERCKQAHIGALEQAQLYYAEARGLEDTNDRLSIEVEQARAAGAAEKQRVERERDESEARRLRLREALQAVYYDRFLRGYDHSIALRSAENAVAHVDGAEAPRVLSDLRSRLVAAEAERDAAFVAGTAAERERMKAEIERNVAEIARLKLEVALLLSAGGQPTPPLPAPPTPEDR